MKPDCMREKSNNKGLDVLKLTCAIAVMAIHSGLFCRLLYPWLYVAVPLFYLMSSYFFFQNKSMELMGLA